MEQNWYTRDSPSVFVGLLSCMVGTAKGLPVKHVVLVLNQVGFRIYQRIC